jgi:hypothetical protein
MFSRSTTRRRAARYLAGVLAIASVSAPVAAASPIDPVGTTPAPAAQHSYVLADKAQAPAPRSFVLADRRPSRGPASAVAGTPSSSANVDLSWGSVAIGAGFVVLLGLGTALLTAPSRRRAGAH